MASDDRPGTGVHIDHAPYFFLSHAAGEDEIYVLRFFRDLCDEVREVLGSGAPTDVGYLDPGSVDSPHWPADAQTALATGRTFVALCSVRYFLSAHCGRSWGVFADRLRRHRGATGVVAPSLIPVPWAVGGLAADLPHADEFELRSHPVPTGDEVRVLLRISSLRPAYRDYVASLARRIVETAHRHRIPPAPADQRVRSARDAFEGHQRRDDGKGLRVCMAVIAGTREQMRPVRGNLGSYGERREEWAPYGPRISQPVMERAVDMLATRRLAAEVVPLESLADRIDAARRRNEIVVLLVDAWATQQDELRAALREVNDRDDDTAAVLVPTNYDDPETDANRGELRVAIRDAFPGRTGRRDLTFHPEVGTVERFDTDLAVAVVEAESRLLRIEPPHADSPHAEPSHAEPSHAEPPRVARPMSRPSQRPILGGP